MTDIFPSLKHHILFLYQSLKTKKTLKTHPAQVSIL